MATYVQSRKGQTYPKRNSRNHVRCKSLPRDITKYGHITNKTSCAITRTENAFVDATKITGLSCVKYDGYYSIKFNLNVTGGSTSDLVEIARISNYSAYQSIDMIVPTQNGSNKNMLLNISTSGVISIYGANGLDSTWYRTMIVVPWG